MQVLGPILHFIHAVKFTVVTGGNGVQQSKKGSGKWYTDSERKFSL